MTNRIAIIIMLTIFGCLFYDYEVYNGANSLFLARKFAELMEWMAFWR